MKTTLEDLYNTFNASAPWFAVICKDNVGYFIKLLFSNRKPLFLLRRKPSRVIAFDEGERNPNLGWCGFHGVDGIPVTWFRLAQSHQDFWSGGRCAKSAPF